MGKMQCYTELIPPSAVTHAVALPFLHPNEDNLVLAKTSLLQIFALKESKSNSRSADGSSDQTSSTSHLLLVGEYPLSGTITSLASIKALNTKTGGDALLISVADAKLSLVEWDPDNHRVSTISIHYYEGENVISAPFGPSLSECGSILLVDPSARCAALKFGARHLAILPFRQLGDELGEGAEDGEDQEMDPVTLKRMQSGFNESSDNDPKQTPYKASFVLPLTALDPSLTHPVHLAFLHEYREPTFGILSASIQPSAALLDERKDVLSYTVFTLDLEQRASTNLISVPKLPSDLWKVVPMPLPVGGALLVGTNEFVHVDQNGKTNAVAVNEFAKTASGFGMTDQSSLNLKLEHCEIEPLDPKTGDLLVMLNDCSLVILSFEVSGRNVGGLNITRVTADNGGSVVEAVPSCLASLHGNKIFVGSENGDSSLLGWKKPTPTLSRKRSHAQMLGQEAEVVEDEGIEDMDDDDLYAPAPEAGQRASSMSGPTAAESVGSYQFAVHDSLPSLGPINNICFGRSPSKAKGKLELVAGVGRGAAGRLVFISKDIVPEVLGTSSFDTASNAWSLRAGPNDARDDNGDLVTDYDNSFFFYDGETTKAYDILSPAAQDGDESSMPMYKERTGTEFEHDGETLAVSTLARGSQIVQCRRSEVRTYDAADLALSQIIPMLDEETDAELQIVHTSFCDPYMLVLRDDSSVQVLRVDEGGDVEPLDSAGDSKERKWLSGCLYAGELTRDEPVAFLLGEEGGLHAFSLPDLQAVYTTPTLSSLPAVLSQDASQRRGGAKETLTELLVSDLGSEDLKQPYLTLRNAMNDLTLYEPFLPLDIDGSGSWASQLRFRKVPMAQSLYEDESAPEENDGRPAPLRSINVAGRAAIHVPGTPPSFIIKEASSLPKVLPLQAQKFKTLIPLHHPGCDRGFGLIGKDGSLKECQLPSNTSLSSGWSVNKLALGEPAQEVRHVAFHEERRMYVVATCRDVDFWFPEEDGRHQDQDGKSDLFSSTPFGTFLVESCFRLISGTHHEHIRRFPFLFRGASSIVDAKLTQRVLTIQPA